MEWPSSNFLPDCQSFFIDLGIVEFQIIMWDVR